MTLENTAPHVVHIVYRLDYGGLENGLANLVDKIPPSCARHTVVALTGSTEFARRFDASRVEVISLEKKPGKDILAYFRLFKLLRRLEPDIVHTRNVGTMDCQVVALLAGVARRIHSEHGWDTTDDEGRSGKYRRMRRWLSPTVQQYVALSREIEAWLVDDIGIPARKVTRICNGVDTGRFHPATRTRLADDPVVVGTVTRFSDIKDPLNTLLAFVHLKHLLGGARAVRLVMVGDGPLRERVREASDEAGVGDDVCLPGSQLDVVPWLEKMDIFVMGSRREGISNTILEAMAAGLPVVATKTGGNVELVVEGATGALVPPRSPEALGSALARYVLSPAMCAEHGAGGRQRVVDEFSLDAMVAKYSSLYARSKVIGEVV